ncbi:endonuclease/exonuclease/phosphatase family protein [Verrucomicrobiota bacterium sgz303538]
MMRLLRRLIVGLGLFVQAGTLLSWSKSSHWLVRLWDFPRVQITTVAAFSGSVFGAYFLRRRNFSDWLFLLGNLLCVIWHGRKIRPYTQLASAQVKRSDPARAEKRSSSNEAAFRLLISNVLMENRDHSKLLKVIAENDPDLILVVEIDKTWEQALEPLVSSYPHVIRQPQDNYYGLMLFSRFPLVEPRIEFLVQEDIPSVHTGFDLPSGDRIFLHGLHPRPPEPIRDQKSTPRDAELVLVGESIGNDGERPTIVAGDLNDVAWSPTSELFLRLSRLLDPRIGRGFYNSYNANQPLLRYPLDHVFHSRHFRLIDLRVLPHIGSDHFPMMIELSYEPDRSNENSAPHPENGDEQEAAEKIEKQEEAAQTGDDRPRQE